MMVAYCMSGCDTTSSFFGHGKKSIFKLMMTKAGSFQPMASIGLSLDEKVLFKAEKESAVSFVCFLYGSPGCTALNHLRCAKAVCNVQGKTLPPTDDSFTLHLERSRYQMFIWRKAVSSKPIVPLATEHGYYIDGNGGLKPKLMSQSPIAPELMNDIICDCEPGMCHVECTCFRNGQPCTSACSCGADIYRDTCCTNLHTMCANGMLPDDDTWLSK